MALQAQEINLGDIYEEDIVKNLTRTQIVQYAGASGDYNPVHTDEIFATKVARYPSVFAHGMLTMGMTGKAVTNYVGDGRLTKYGVRFSKQVWPGDSLHTKLTVTRIRQDAGQHFVDIEVETKNDKDEVVLIGTATARIDA